MCFTLVSVYVHTVDLVALANILNPNCQLGHATELFFPSALKQRTSEWAQL
jgi:hypothetical protein